MKTIGFFGKSGTGKSYKALSVAGDNGIRMIVDDGLLICDNKILAGKSAKKEKTKYASTKRAIFMDEAHCEEVANAIKASGQQSIMVIGTSDRMVDLIAERIGVGPVDEYIRIEDVSTADEIKTASVMRNEYGKHVIPLPTLEVKKTFSGYLLDPLNTIKNFFGKNVDEESTIIRPTYSYLGDFEISEKVLCQIAAYEAEKVDGVYSIEKVHYTGDTTRHEFRMDAVLKLGYDFKKVCLNVQDRVIDAIDASASVYIDMVNVNIVGLATDD